MNSNCRKSGLDYIIGYFLLFTLGWLGIHRYYYGKWQSGLLYTFTFGFLGIGILVDLFLLPKLIRGHIKEHKAEQLLLFEPSLYPVFPKWFKNQVSPIGRGEYFVRILFLIFGPGAIVTLIIGFDVNVPEITLFFIAILVMTGFFSSYLWNIKSIVLSNHKLSKIPFLIEISSNISKFYEFYFNNKPNHIVYYILYPIIAPFKLLRSDIARKELGLYWGVFYIILMTVLLNFILSYNDNILPYLSFENAIAVFIPTIVWTPIIIIFLMPVVTTSFVFAYSNKSKSIKIFTMLGLIWMLWAVYSTQGIGLVQSLRLSHKIEKIDFKKDLVELSSMFLTYQIRNFEEDNNTHIESKEITVNDYLTNKYRKLLAGLLPKSETDAFYVINIPLKINSATCLGVHFFGGAFKKTNNILLIVVDQKQRVYLSWKDLPNELKDKYKVISEIDSTVKFKRYNEVSKPILVDDI